MPGGNHIQDGRRPDPAQPSHHKKGRRLHVGRDNAPPGPFFVQAQVVVPIQAVMAAGNPHMPGKSGFPGAVFAGGKQVEIRNGRILGGRIGAGSAVVPDGAVYQHQVPRVHSRLQGPTAADPDSRPYADEDDPQHHHTPIDGANDGASGVGVLLEIARQLQQQAPAIGIDIVFFDAEDYGTPDFYQGKHPSDSWCLGSQYWGRIPHTPDYKARFGILLDMVGAPNATFYYEYYSKETANDAMKKIWKTAESLGYGNYFVPQDGGSITDDHIYVHSFRQIPCVDIIHYDTSTNTGFVPTWHTLDDTLEHIDKSTLKAVGQTVMTVIYNEK